MTRENPTGINVTIDRVRITGAPSDVNVTGLSNAIQTAFGRKLGHYNLVGPEQSRNIPRLTLHLPPGAGASEIAEALAGAIENVGKGGQP